MPESGNLDLLERPPKELTGRGAYIKKVMLLGGILSRYRFPQKTSEIHKAYTGDVGWVHRRTILRWLWFLAELGIVEPIGTEKNYQWQFLGWPE